MLPGSWIAESWTTPVLGPGPQPEAKLNRGWRDCSATLTPQKKWCQYHENPRAREAGGRL